ncbi:hypothetical protein AHiyo6_19610 [Arthrobacter sp. Hiyo6]|nr:hypothetical protein AHiyo6_19610 [Arthrobacter sp. Hiyo6]
MLVGRVVQRQVDDYADAAGMRFRHQALEVADGAELVQNGVVVRNVVAAITERRLEERREPQTIHAKPLQVVQFVDQSMEVA